MPPAPVRTAVIGLGRMGRFHLAALSGVPALDVVALAEPSPAARAEAAAIRPHATAYADVASALAHPGVEACLVATPTPTHAAVVGAALDSGLHVLCEKPLSLDTADSARLGPGAAACGLVLQIGFWRRFSPPWQAAKGCLERGAVGNPVVLRLAQWDAAPPPPAFCDPAVSGGLAIDCGVHEYDLAEWLTGRRIRRVAAWTPPVVDAGVAAAGDVDNLVAVLELDGGSVATVELSRNARYGDDVRTEIVGTAGALLVELLPTGRTRVGTSDGLVEVPGSHAADAMAAGVAEQGRAFAAAVRGERPPGPGAAASERATAVGHAVVEAARIGAPVEIGGRR